MSASLTSTKHRILQHGPLLPSLEAQLAHDFDLHRLTDEADPQAYLHTHGGEFIGLVASAAIGVDAALVDALPALRVISSFGVGFDKLDASRTVPRGIAVGHTPDVLNDCVADLAFALMLDVARGVSAAERFVRRSDWLTGRAPLGTRVSGKRLGIVGLGRIGRAIAKRAVGFDMEVAYSGRSQVDGVPYAFEPSLTALAEWADFLVVAVAGGVATRHLVSRDVLTALGPKGFLVNVARGTVIDEAALVEALVQRRIAGAGLDVFENEPQVPQALMALDNVVLLPHIASGTHETRQAMADLVLTNLHSFFDKGRLQCAVPWPL